MNLFANQDLLGVFQALTTKKSKTKMELFTAICWANWHSRNLFTFEGKNEDSQVSLAKAEAIVEAYRKIKPPPLMSSQSQTPSAEQSWKPSPKGCLNINLDVATKSQNKIADLGVVIRDSKGEFVAAAQKQESFFGDVLAAEVKVIQWGFEVVEAAGGRPLIIESDCKEAVDLVLGRKCSRAEVDWIIADIQESLKRMKGTKIQHISRLCNDIAHSIAKLALNNVEPNVWIENCLTHLLFFSQFRFNES